jgi:hypothetical protein
VAQNLHPGAFQQNRDFSLIRHFKLSERQDLRFTADFFNPWNHADFGSPHVADYEQHLLLALAQAPDESKPVRRDRQHHGTPSADSVLSVLDILIRAKTRQPRS